MPSTPRRLTMPDMSDEAVPSSVRDLPLFRAKAILGDNYVVMTREQLDDLIVWLMHSKPLAVLPDDVFAEWVVRYGRRRFGQPLQNKPTS